MIREHRLYQADWLMRFYGFKVQEIVSPDNPLLDMDIDPKLAWALRNPDKFPVDINKADYNMIMRVPGIGIKSAANICQARKFRTLNSEHLKKLGVAFNRARYFIICDKEYEKKELQPMQLRQMLISAESKYRPNFSPQLKIF